jgi:hypothetical protein
MSAELAEPVAHAALARAKRRAEASASSCERTSINV